MTQRAAPPAGSEDSFDTIVAALREAGRLTGASTIRRLAGGVSSFIAVVDEDTAPWVAKASRHRLDVAEDWTADPRRAHREGAVLRALAGRLGPLRVPLVYRVHEAPPILELEWFGPPAVNWKDELLAGRVDLTIVGALARGMAVLHQTALPAGLDRDTGALLFETLRLAPYYREVAARRPQDAPALAALIAECASPAAACLVHGDFTPKNVLATGGDPVLLDWEVVHAGDPAFDLGMLSAHLLLKACRSAPVTANPAWTAARALAAGYDGPADPGLAVRHAGAIMLARLWGKSTVDYLRSPSERSAAADIGRRALHGGCRSLPALLDDLHREGL